VIDPGEPPLRRPSLSRAVKRPSVTQPTSQKTPAQDVPRSSRKRDPILQTASYAVEMLSPSRDHGLNSCIVGKSSRGDSVQWPRHHLPPPALFRPSRASTTRPSRMVVPPQLKFNPCNDRCVELPVARQLAILPRSFSLVEADHLSSRLLVI
jgi:hypothetical protein